MINSFVGIGYLSKDAEKMSSSSAVSMAKFTLAIQRRYANQDGEKETDFINCVAFRSVADNIVKYCHKGDRIAVQGYVQTRTYDAQDGTKRYVTEVVVENCEFLTTKKIDEGKTEEPKMQPVDDGTILPF